MNQKTKSRLELAYRIISDLVDLALTIVCFVKLLDSYSLCNKFEEFSYVGTDQCSVQSNCSYYAANQLSAQQLKDENCYLNYQHGYLKMDIASGNQVVYSVIGVLVVQTLLKIYLYLKTEIKRYTRLKLSFFANFMQFTLNCGNFIMSTVNCASICAQMSLSDQQNTALYSASVGFVCLALLFIYGVAYCFCQQGEPGCCDYLFIFGCILTGIVAFDVSAGLILATKSTIFHVEVPLKILLVFQLIKSLYGLYKIFTIKKNKGDGYTQM
ncbi:hypothetical protein ABPG72_000346 [Tetrahymena utriculariae]